MHTSNGRKHNLEPGWHQPRCRCSSRTESCKERSMESPLVKSEPQPIVTGSLKAYFEEEKNCLVNKNCLLKLIQEWELLFPLVFIVRVSYENKFMRILKD